jgi:hypothetical protein
MQCKHCSNDYRACKYNSNRQKYCSRQSNPNCYRTRKAKEARQWRVENPDFYIDDSERTADYRHQKNTRRRLLSASKSVVLEIKREFVSLLHASANVLENQLLTFTGLLSFHAGGLVNASALETCKRLQRCYEDGVILKESDPILTSYLENMYEKITRLDKS